MALTTAELLRLQALDLDYDDVKELLSEAGLKGDIDTLSLDWTQKQTNINVLADSSTATDKQVALNVIEIALNAQNLTDHIDDPTDAHAATAILYDNTVSGLSAINDQDAIDEVDQNLDNHIADTVGAHAASAISYDNTTSGLTATETQSAIDEVDGDLDTHIADDSAHGVGGVNVGTTDFATSILGGVVLEATNVANAVESTVTVTSPDATAAPVAYDQTDAQTAVTLVNELKADLNQAISDFNAVTVQLNAFLAANQTANQMA